MQIHVVQYGDTMWEIAHKYNVPEDFLIYANQIENPSNIVSGQTIVIPIMGRYHWLEDGESLYDVSKLYNVSESELMRVNNITDPTDLQKGYRIFIPQTPRILKEIGAYVDIMYNPNKEEYIYDNGNFLSNVYIASYAIDKDGNLSTLDDKAEIEASYIRNARPIMVISNLEDGDFSKELATDFLTNETAQKNALNEILAIMQEKNYLGADFDFENLGAENSQRYVDFLKKAMIKLKPHNYIVSATLTSKTSDDQPGDYFEGHDYEGIGKVVDVTLIMTYEWGWAGGPPMPVAPLPKVEEVLNYALTRIPREKISMGIPLYGYDWELPYKQGETIAKSLDTKKAYELAGKYGTNIEYDEISQAPNFTYVNDDNKTHKVWFEDAKSIQAKFDLVNKLNLDKFFYWQLGFEVPQNWLLILDNYIVDKMQKNK